MRLLMRNTTEFVYFPYTGVENDLNEHGEHTGEFHQQYGDPVVCRGNISTPSGHTNQTFYGQDIRYTHTLVMGTDEGFNERGIIRWKGKCYEITAVRPSINSVSIALRQMTADEGKPFEPDPEPNEEAEDGDEP